MGRCFYKETIAHYRTVTGSIAKRSVKGEESVPSGRSPSPCGRRARADRDWIRPLPPSHGIERLEAGFAGHAYDRHRHETYAIGLTCQGVQSFHYRGALRRSLPGEVVVLHPDEAHDGHAGTSDGFAYRLLYVEPSLISHALDGLVGPGATLPFAREVVAADPDLAGVITEAFVAGASGFEDLAADELILRLAEGLLRRDPYQRPRRLSALAVRAVERARELLDEEYARAVRSHELERITGLDRFALARHFRARFGTSPYRYLLGRRLQRARACIRAGSRLADVATECGFADQSQMTRQHKDRFGLTPGQYARLLTAPT